MRFRQRSKRNYHPEEPVKQLPGQHPYLFHPWQSQCVAAFRAGASLIPSPVMATTSPLFFRAFTSISFCSGTTLANTFTFCNSLAKIHFRHRFQLLPIYAIVVIPKTNLLCNVHSSYRVVTGDHDHPDPCPVTFRKLHFLLLDGWGLKVR